MKKEPLVEVPVKVKIISNGIFPARSTSGSEGYDLSAVLTEPIVLSTHSCVLCDTGVTLSLPYGYFCLVTSRSGLAYKHGVVVLNSPGLIDNDYTGEIKVLLFNHGSEAFTINHGDRIAQLIIMRSDPCILIPTDIIPESSNRGAAGFGSTGVALVEPINYQTADPADPADHNHTNHLCIAQPV